MDRRLAARPKCCSSPTPTKYRKCRNSIRYLPGIKTIAKISWTDCFGSFHSGGGSNNHSDGKRRYLKALVVNAPGGGFDLDDVQIAAPMGREVLVDVVATQKQYERVQSYIRLGLE